MHHNLKLSALAAVLILAGCGGSDSDPPVTPSVAYTGTVLAGVASGSTYAPDDTEPGCMDGAALGAKLQPSSTGAFARTGDGHLVLSELGACDGRNRIRSINPGANAIKTLSIGASQSWDSTEPLTTFLTPTSIATAPSGEIYIADSDVFTGQIPSALRKVPGRGSGIWKLDTDGTISLLAGVVLPSVGMTGVGTDGQGTAASFGILRAMCHGADGLLYVTHNTRLRTVDASGVVSTIPSAGEEYRTILACGPDGSVLVRRWFQNPADDDYYDPIVLKSIAKASAVGTDLRPLAYFGSSNPSVVIQSDSTPPTLALLNLIDGSTAAIAKLKSPADLAAISSSLSELAIGGSAINRTDFALLTRRAMLQLTRE